MRAIELIVLSDEGLLSAYSSKSTPVSAVRFDAVSGLTSCPVATRRDDTLGTPYVCIWNVSCNGE